MQYIYYIQYSKMLFRNIVAGLRYKYGELTYTQQLAPTLQFARVNTYRVMDLQGNLLDGKVKYDCGQLAKILRTMIQMDELDRYFLKIKTQGKISFYMSSFGQHATVIGAAASLSAQDWLYTQYREQGAHLWRGYSIEQMFNQCMGNCRDLGRGRQMPIHYGSKRLRNVTISSPLTTQVPQAVGTGYSLRTSNQPLVSAVFFGEGAASEGDFAPALNFAITLRCQTLFLCRNNKYAISTPYTEQYRSDGIVPRAIAHGVASVRVDGNDALAVVAATTMAREYILAEKKPFFIEYMTYRMGDHSTSDNSALYRQEEEKKEWRKNDPIRRLTLFLQKMQYADVPDQAVERENTQKIFLKTMRECEKHLYPSIDSLFQDVYHQLPAHLEEQKRQLKAHLEVYGDKYQFLKQFQK